MSRDTKRTWSEQVDEFVQKNLSEKMKPNSRENSNSRKKSKPSSDLRQSKPKKPIELETDPAVLQRRQKQIDYGKNTVGYVNYTQQIPTDQRTKDHPQTPDKYSKYSRRGWDMLIKIWRKKLHEFDTDGNDNDDDDGNDNEDVNDNEDGDDNKVVDDVGNDNEDCIDTNLDCKGSNDAPLYSLF